jgi:hypothetical protein
MRASLPFRAWFYFRMGYSVYLSFLLAVVNVMVTVYYLAVTNIPELESVFPNFTSWAVTVIVVGIPLSIFIGWVHLKRSPAFRSEMDVAVESNPYYYKLPPGYWKDAIVPVMLETMKLNMKLLNRESLSESEKKSLKELQLKLEHLIDGGRIDSQTTTSKHSPATNPE